MRKGDKWLQCIYLHDGVAPIHQRDFFTLADDLCILLFQPYLLHSPKKSFRESLVCALLPLGSPDKSNKPPGILLNTTVFSSLPKLLAPVCKHMDSSGTSSRL